VHLQLAPVGLGELAKRVGVSSARSRERGRAYRVVGHEFLASACRLALIG
jgi:hypothetical protein